MNLLEDYPKVIFDCTLNLNQKKNFLKKFSINSKNESKNLELYVNGNLNILNNKINFKNISTNDQYVASNEDLIYFKKTFENILFDESFFEIFNLNKIRNFILEVS